MKILNSVFFILFSFISTAQVGIGTTTPNAALDIESTDDGLLIPRIALTATNVATVVTPTVSELVYNTATAGIAPNDVTPGFYYWDGVQWVRVLMNTNNNWSIDGNDGTDPTTNFLGTTDNQDLVIRTNNTENIRVNTDGNVGIGTTSNAARLYVNLPNTDVTTNYGIYNNFDGADAGATYGIWSQNYGSGNGTKYGIYNYVNNEGTGGRYGIYNSVYMNSSSVVSGTGFRNYLSTQGPGVHDGIYNYVTTITATGVHYGQRNYLYLPTSNSSDAYGEFTFVDYSSGTRYGEFKSMSTNTSATGIVYGDFNTINGNGNDIIYGVCSDILNTGSGTHYGLYSNTPGGVNDYAAFFNAGNVVANEVGGDYDFRIEGTADVNLFKVDASQNNVGIGVATPTYKLDVYTPDVTTPSYVYRGRNGFATGTRTQIGSIEYFLDQSSTIDFSGGSNFSINLNAAAGYDLQLAVNSAAKPGSNVWIVASDKRLKEDINDFKDGLNVLKKIHPVYYKYNGKANIKEKNYFIGVIAQELEEVAPYMVGSFESTPGNIPFESQEAQVETYKSVDNGAMTYIAINAIKELDDNLLKIKEVVKNISDFGVETLNSSEIFVGFDTNFKNQLQGIPVVVVTPLNSTSNLTIIKQTNEGFYVKLNGIFEPTTFNWVAMAKIKEEVINNKRQYSEHERQSLLNKVKAEKATINFEAEHKEATKRKIEEQLNKSNTEELPLPKLPKHSEMDNEEEQLSVSE